MALGAICCGHDTRCERLSMPGTALFEKPRWLRDLLRFLPLKSQFVLSGNIRDLQACEVVPGTVTAQSFNQTLGDALLDAGYAQVLAWDPLAGFRVLGRPGSEARATPFEPGEIAAGG
ncbi:ATP-dependent Clp protease ATP-binding subunit, partial [Pseudomonas aeruginosa]|nr:ATP-dependent Clp protease ATP-binding subunit [Pseudomonas aeruginosa]